MERFLFETCDTRTVIADDNALYFGAKLNDSSLIPADNSRLGSRNFDTWLSQTLLKA